MAGLSRRVSRSLSTLDRKVDRSKLRHRHKVERIVSFLLKNQQQWRKQWLRFWAWLGQRYTRDFSKPAWS